MQLPVLGAFNESRPGAHMMPQLRELKRREFPLGHFVMGLREIREETKQVVRAEAAFPSATTLTFVGGTGSSFLGSQTAFVSRPTVGEVLMRDRSLEVAVFDVIEVFDVVSVWPDIAAMPLQDLEVSRSFDVGVAQRFWHGGVVDLGQGGTFGGSETQRGERRLPYASLIRGLIENDDISAARSVLDAIPSEAIEEPALQALRRVLAPPRVTTRRITDSDRSREYQWLLEHKREYSGKWVAVEGDRLIAIAESLKELLNQLRGLNVAKRPLIHRLA